MVLYEALSLTVYVFASLLALLVAIGALSRLCSRSKTLDRPYDDFQSWQDTSPQAPPKAGSLRRANSSKLESLREGRPVYSRNSSAPSGKVASPTHLAHLLPEKSSSSGSSLYEKARKNWMSTMDERLKEGSMSLALMGHASAQASPDAQQEPRLAPAPALEPPSGEQALRPAAASSPPPAPAAATSPSPSPPRPLTVSSLLLAALFLFLLILSSLVAFRCLDASCAPHGPVDAWCPSPRSSPWMAHASRLFCSSRMRLPSLPVAPPSEGLLLRLALGLGGLCLAAVLLGLLVHLSSRPRRPVVVVSPLPPSPDADSSGELSSPPPDFANVVATELEAAGLQVFRADPRGVQIPENINLDNLEKSLVVVLALPKGEFARESCLMELKLALERRQPLLVVKEQDYKPVGPPDFCGLVQATLQDASVRVLTWDEGGGGGGLRGAVGDMVRATQGSGCWDVFVTHPCKHRVDSSLFRAPSPVDVPHVAQSFRVSTVKDALAVLVAHVGDVGSMAALSKLIIAQGKRGFLKEDETGTLVAILRAKGLVREGSNDSLSVEHSTPSPVD